MLVSPPINKEKVMMADSNGVVFGIGKFLLVSPTLQRGGKFHSKSFEI